MRPGSIIHQEISDSGIAEVFQTDNHRTLYFGNSVKQSEMDLSHPETLTLAYTQTMMAALLFCIKPRSILLIGLGGGSLVRFLLHHFPDCRVDAVESRSDVVSLAYDYFLLPQDGRLHVTVGDGLEFLTANHVADKQYELILIDAFDHYGIADSIKSIRFFSACHTALHPQGVLAINLWASQLDQYRYTLANVESAFDHNLLNIPVKDRGNRIVFATHTPEIFSSFKTLKPVAELLEQKLALPFGTYLRDIRRHNRWRGLSRLF